MCHSNNKISQIGNNVSKRICHGVPADQRIVTQRKMFVDKQEREEKTTNDQDWSSKDKTCVHSTTVKLLFHLVLVLLVTIVIFAVCLFQQNYRLRSLETYLLDQDHRNALAVARKNLDLNLVEDQSGQYGEVKENIEPGRLQRLSESQFNSKSGKTKSRDTTQVTETFFHKLTRNVRNAQSTNCKINIHDVLQSYCYYKKKVSRKNTAVTFPTVFDEQLYQKINIREDPNCVLYEQTFPEKWCVFRTIEFLKQGSPVKVFSNSPNSMISFNSSSGIFRVDKAGTYLVFGSISIISINQSIQLLGLHRDNTALVTCPSDGLGIARADNVEKSQKKRYCNMNGVLKLELGDQLQLKTMVPNVQLLLDHPESISWLLLTEI